MIPEKVQSFLDSFLVLSEVVPILFLFHSSHLFLLCESLLRETAQLLTFPWRLASWGSLSCFPLNVGSSQQGTAPAEGRASPRQREACWLQVSTSCTSWFMVQPPVFLILLKLHSEPLGLFSVSWEIFQRGLGEEKDKTQDSADYKLGITHFNYLFRDYIDNT